MQTARSERRSNASQAGFTLVELLIVMSVILILMTLAIPEMMKVIKQSNQTSAIQSLRDLNSQEAQYNSTYPTHGYACTLAETGRQGGFWAAVA